MEYFSDLFPKYYGLAYYKLNEYSKAMADYSKAKEFDPNNPNIDIMISRLSASIM